MTSLTAISHLLQVNGQLEELRLKLNEPLAPLSNDSLLTISTQLQPLYKKLLITNLDDALARQLELSMWNDCFKSPLTRFGRLDKNLFYLMIETGVGFYLGLIQDIGIHFDISFITNATSTNKLYCTKTSQSPLVSPSKASVYYIIQNCLLHVGDLLRYQCSFPEAIKMYDKSAAVYPSNGHPYHQMGATQMLITAPDDYVTINNCVTAFYYHARALAVPNPYMQSYHAFETVAFKILNMPVGNNKYQEFLRQFLLMTASIIRKDMLPPGFASSIIPMLTPLVTNQQIKPSILFQMICILIWIHWRMMCGEGGVDFAKNEENLLEIIVALLNAIVIAAFGLFSEQHCFLSNLSDRKFATSVHLKLLLDWLSRLYQNEKALRQIKLVFDKVNMGKLVKVLNLMKASVQETEDDLGVGNNFILPEEKRLIGFLPLDYSMLRTGGAVLLDEANPKTQNYRLYRLIQSAIALSHPHSSTYSSNSSSNFAFIAYDGSDFGEPLMCGLSPILLPNRRNVALTSIFRSGLSSSGCGGNGNGANFSLNTTPSLVEYGDGNSSFGSSIGFGGGGISPTNSTSSLSPMNVPTLSVLNPTPGSSFLSPPTTTSSDPFRSIWTPDADTTTKPTKTDSTWN